MHRNSHASSSLPSPPLPGPFRCGDRPVRGRADGTGGPGPVAGPAAGRTGPDRAGVRRRHVEHGRRPVSRGRGQDRRQMAPPLRRRGDGGSRRRLPDRPAQGRSGPGRRRAGPVDPLGQAGEDRPVPGAALEDRAALRGGRDQPAGGGRPRYRRIDCGAMAGPVHRPPPRRPAGRAPAGAAAVDPARSDRGGHRGDPADQSGPGHPLDARRDGPAHRAVGVDDRPDLEEVRSPAAPPERVARRPRRVR